MRRYRLKAIMDFLANFRGYATINQVAEGVGMAWNTAQKDLDFLANEDYLIKIGRGKRVHYKFNFRMNH